MWLAAEWYDPLVYLPSAVPRVHMDRLRKAPLPLKHAFVISMLTGRHNQHVEFEHKRTSRDSKRVERSHGLHMERSRSQHLGGWQDAGGPKALAAISDTR